MVIRKEKEFIAPLVAAGRVAMTAAPMLLGQKQSKESNKEMAKQTAAIKAQTRELKKLQKNPNVDPAQVSSVMQNKQNNSEEEEKSFAMPAWANNTINNVKTVGRDLYNAGNAGGINSFVKTQVRNAAIASTAMYGLNKYLQRRRKKKGLEVTKDGNLTATYRAYSAPQNNTLVPASTPVQTGTPAPTSVMKRVAGKIGRGAFTTIANLPYGEGLSLYYQHQEDERNAGMGLVDATAKSRRSRKKQRTYSEGNSTSVLANTAKKGYSRALRYYKLRGGRILRDNVDAFKSHPMQTISGAANRYLSGFAGTKNVQGFAGSLSGSTNKALATAGKFMQNHKAVGNIAMAAPLYFIGKKTMKVARKGIDKVYRTLDPNAYRYSDAKAEQQKRQMQAAQQQYNNYRT